MTEKQPSFLQSLAKIYAKTFASRPSNSIVDTILSGLMMCITTYIVSESNIISHLPSIKKLLTFRKILVITDKSIITKFIKFIGDEPTKFDIIVGNNSVDNMCMKPITFRHNITGTLCFTSAKEEIVSMKLTTYETGQTLEQFVNEVCTMIDKKENEKSNRTLYCVTHNDKTEHVTTMYTGSIVPTEELEKTFIKTMFHKDITELWQRVKDIHFHPEKIWGMGIAPRANFLLYGPPGTGKSTFAYRIAMTTCRHIINVELSHYTKDELIDLFRAPKINDKIVSPNEVVFVLDEFDNDIKNIMFKTECKRDQLKKIDGYLDKLFNESIGTSEKSDKPTENKESKIDQVEKYLTTITETYDKVNSIGTQIIRIEDLLTIFQGSVPIIGCIIIAMTNNYDDLVKQCPALFRRGRLTPIHFGHFDMRMLEKVSRHYFGKSLIYDTKDEADIGVPPSHIMEIINDAMLKPNKKYDYFVDKVNECLINKVSKVMGVENELVPCGINIRPNSEILVTTNQDSKNIWKLRVHVIDNTRWICNMQSVPTKFKQYIKSGPTSYQCCDNTIISKYIDTHLYEVISTKLIKKLTLIGVCRHELYEYEIKFI